MNYTTFFLFLSILLSCNPPKKATDSTVNTSVPTMLNAERLITLEKGACYGRCPIYKIHINNDGSMELEGKRFIDFIGPHTGNLPKAELDALKANIKSLAWDSYPEDYPTQISDLPSSKLTHYNSKKNYNTRWSHGAPEELETLAGKIHEIALNSAWKNDPNQEASPNHIPHEFIVKLNDEESLNPFIEEFKAYGLTMKEQLVPSMPMYTFYYDSSLAFPFEMLNLLKASKLAQLVEFNKKVDKRD